MRDTELAKLAGEEARVLRDNDIELAKLTQQEELARLKSEHEKDKKIELARLHFEHETLKMEQEIELTQIDSQEWQAKQDSDLSRFEKYVVANKWDRSFWAAYLRALLKGWAFEV